MKKLILAPVLLILAACAEPHYTWEHYPPLPPEQANQQLHGDMAFCSAQANAAVAGAFSGDAMGQAFRMEALKSQRMDCMIGKGWTRKEMP